MKAEDKLSRSGTTVTIGKVFKVVGGGTPSTSVSNFWRGSIPWITSADLDDHLKITPRKGITKEAIDSSATNLVPAGSVIVATRVGLGKVGIAAAPLCFSQDCQGLIADLKTCDPRFAALQLKQRVQIFRHISRGTTIRGVTKKQLLDLPFGLPSPERQRRIVAEIEKEFTRLDAGVAALLRVQANLKRYRAAVLKAACAGRLVPTEAELARQEGRDYETGGQLLQRILAARRGVHDLAQKKKYRDPISPSGKLDEGLPEGWAWATWDQVALSQNGRPFPSSEYQTVGFKLLRPGNLHISGKVVWTEDNTRYMPQHWADENPDLIVRGCELVMNLTAQSLNDEFLGRVCLTGDSEECLLNQRLARLTPILVLPEFALYLLKGWRFRRFVDELNSGSLIQHMFTSQLSEFTFPLPPLAEQARIVAEVERRLGLAEELDAFVRSGVQRAHRLRPAILQQAFGDLLI